MAQRVSDQMEPRAASFDRKPRWRNEGIRVARDGQGLDVSNASAAAIEAIDLLRDEWLAFGKRLLATVADNPVRDAREIRVAILPCESRECVPEPVNRSNKACVATALAERLAQLADEARERCL